MGGTQAALRPKNLPSRIDGSLGPWPVDLEGLHLMLILCIRCGIPKLICLGPSLVCDATGPMRTCVVLQ